MTHIDNWQCTEHDQKEWTCMKHGGYEFHHKNDPRDLVFMAPKNQIVSKPVRCLNCMCKHKDNPTDEIDKCPLYTGMMVIGTFSEPGDEPDDLKKFWDEMNEDLDSNVKFAEPGESAYDGSKIIKRWWSYDEYGLFPDSLMDDIRKMRDAREKKPKRLTDFIRKRPLGDDEHKKSDSE